MLYILLIVIIVLLLVIIYSQRDKGAYWNKLFRPIKGIKQFDREDDRNKTHPKEFVRFQFRYMERQEAVKEAEGLEKLFRNAWTTDEDIDTLLYPEKSMEYDTNKIL